jgi:hypothetical protein
LLLSALVFPWFAGAVVFGLISGSVMSWPQSPTHQALWAAMSFNLIVSLGSKFLLGLVAVRRRRLQLAGRLLLMPA